MVSLTTYSDRGVLMTILRGVEHPLTVNVDISGMGQNEAAVTVIAETLQHIHRPVTLTIYTGSSYVYGVLKNRWLERWADSGWVNSKGRPVRYQKRWQQVYEALTKHNYQVEMKEA